MATPDSEFRKALYQSFSDGVLEADSECYEPIYEEHPDLKKLDQVSLISESIQFAANESLTLFSGFQGSGKSTELKRLAVRLRAAGYFVLEANAREYFARGEEIDITVLLNALAGAFSDRLKASEFGDALEQGYWTRFYHYLKSTNVDLTEIGIKAGSSAVGAEGSLKLAFSQTPSFRQQLKKILTPRLGEVTREVHAFLSDCRRVIEEKRGREGQIVFIFDQFEQMPGAAKYGSEQRSVVESTQQLFSEFHALIKLPFMHTVLTVPSWLRFVLPGLEYRAVPNVPLWKNDKSRTARADSYKCLRSLIARRFDKVEPGAFDRFFGVPDAKGVHAGADKLIAQSGGHFRDLLWLMRETIVRAQVLPADDSSITEAIYTVRASYLPIALEDAAWLKKVGELREPAHDSCSDASIARLAHFMNTHMMMYFINGHPWYDVHPLIRDEVVEIARRAEKLAGQTTLRTAQP